jgi:hypothetical protein
MQERNELLRSYTRCFFDVRATITNISEEDIIDCFYNGITDPGIYRDFGRNRPKTVAGLRDMMHDWSEQEDDDQEDHGCNPKFQDASKVVNVIFGGDEDFGSRRDQKLLLREILSIELAVPRPLRWSEVPISFSRDDQWTSFSEPGKFPLVLDPVVEEVKLT